MPMIVASYHASLVKNPANIGCRSIITMSIKYSQLHMGKLYMYIMHYCVNIILLKVNSPLVANAIKFLIDLLKGNLVLCIQHVLVSLQTEVFLMVENIMAINSSRRCRLTLSCSVNSIQARQLLAVAIYTQ